VKKIEAKFSQLGGDVEEIEGVEKIGLGWRKDIALSLTGDRRTFHCINLILNAPLQSFKEVQGEGRKVLLKWGERIQPRYVMLSTFVGIREKVVPVGMKDLVVSLLDLDKPEENGNLLFIALSPRSDERWAPEGRRALIVQSLLSFRSLPQLHGNGGFSAHQDAVMRHMKQIMPFLEESVEVIDSDWTREQVSHWSYSHFLYEPRVPVRWKEGIVPTRMRKGLYFAGKENFPYLGWEGEALAGLMTATQILEK
jgi:hypothetical protein